MIHGVCGGVGGADAAQLLAATIEKEWDKAERLIRSGAQVNCKDDKASPRGIERNFCVCVNVGLTSAWKGGVSYIESKTRVIVRATCLAHAAH